MRLFAYTWGMLRRSVGSTRYRCSAGSIMSAAIICLCTLGPWIQGAKAQVADPLADIGVPPFLSAIPVENGSISMVNGDLHLEIPLGSIPQRGLPAIKLALVYDSLYVMDNFGGCCGVGPVWKFVNSGALGSIWYDVVYGHVCSLDGITEDYTYKNFSFKDPYGTTRTFSTVTTQGIQTRCGTHPSNASGNSFASDSSGYHVYVTNFTQAVVYGPDGEQVSGTIKDTNGNSTSGPNCQYATSVFNTGFNPTPGICNLTDTLGRSLVSASLNGNTLVLSILNSQGGTSTYTITLENVNYNTNFSSGNPASGSLQVIKSLALPDGTSYQFGYDLGTTPGYYGQLMTCPPTPHTS
jgi:hypothetical protein